MWNCSWATYPIRTKAGSDSPAARRRFVAPRSLFQSQISSRGHNETSGGARRQSRHVGVLQRPQRDSVGAKPAGHVHPMDLQRGPPTTEWSAAWLSTDGYWVLPRLGRSHTGGRGSFQVLEWSRRIGRPTPLVSPPGSAAGRGALQVLEARPAAIRMADRCQGTGSAPRRGCVGCRNAVSGGDELCSCAGAGALRTTRVH